MNIKFVLVINSKIPTIVGILEFMTRTNGIFCRFEQVNGLICLFFNIKETFYNLYFRFKDVTTAFCGTFFKCNNFAKTTPISKQINTDPHNLELGFYHTIVEK